MWNKLQDFSRAILLGSLSADPVSPTPQLDLKPPHTEVLQLDFSSGACPQGFFIAHLSQSWLGDLGLALGGKVVPLFFKVDGCWCFFVFAMGCW